MTYQEAKAYIDKIAKSGSVLGLDTIRELLDELGRPQKDLTFVHIAGTNGKGSVLAYLSTVLLEAGYRVGRYVSPTVVSYLERIQVNGKWIPEETFAELTDIVRKAIVRMEAAGHTSPTVFEAETAIAFLYFQKTGCDLVVLEAGLGGALDATNVIDPPLCAVFTSISMDHIGVLGNTLAEIAADKAGIIKSGSAVVTAPQSPEVRHILQSRAKDFGCPFYEVDPEHIQIHSEDYLGTQLSYREFSRIFTPLAGTWQKDNAAAALETIRFLRSMGYRIPDTAVHTGFQKTVWPGRFTCLNRRPLFFADGAHNENAARRLKDSLVTYFPGKRLIFLMGVFRDKEYEKIAALMGPLAKSVYTVSLPDEERTLPAEALAETMRGFCKEDTLIRAVSSVSLAVAEALANAEADDIIIAFGSLSYLGQVMQIVGERNR